MDDRTAAGAPRQLLRPRQLHALSRCSWSSSGRPSRSPTSCAARVAFALSQIFVTSGVDNGRNYAMRHYQQVFRDRAFGNFHDLMVAVTLSPMMGDYLDMANNNKANPATGTNPNENYAREILQLFSIGLYQLNADGSLRRDAAGRSIPTYDLDEIEGFARAFTGWTYPTVPGAVQRGNNPRNYLGTMRPVPANHETGAKQLLGGILAPANLTPEQDLAFAHAQHLRPPERRTLHHPATHPEAGDELPDAGLRGARGGRLRRQRRGHPWRPARGGARHPHGPRGARRPQDRPRVRQARRAGASWMASIARAFGGRTDGVFFRAQSAALGQFAVDLLSVFNYYPPDYVVPGTASNGPEFGILNTGTAIARANFATALVFTPEIAPDATVYGATGNGAGFPRAGRRRPPTPARLPIASTASCSPAGCRWRCARPSSPR